MTDYGVDARNPIVGAISSTRPMHLGVEDPPFSYLVVGKVVLYDVLTFQPPPTMKVGPPGPSTGRKWAAWHVARI
jgi:hypothetical protein